MLAIDVFDVNSVAKNLNSNNSYRAWCRGCKHIPLALMIIRIASVSSLLPDAITFSWSPSHADKPDSWKPVAMTRPPSIDKMVWRHVRTAYRRKNTSDQKEYCPWKWGLQFFPCDEMFVGLSLEYVIFRAAEYQDNGDDGRRCVCCISLFKQKGSKSEKYWSQPESKKYLSWNNDPHPI